MTLSRRSFLASGAALGAGIAIDHFAPRTAVAAAQAKSSDSPENPLSHRVPFEGQHQAGILTPPPQVALFASFDSIATSRGDLAQGIEALSDRARRLTSGYTALLGAPDGEGPTPDSGVLGTQPPPDSLTATIGFGSSLFDDRYGLGSRRPAGLKAMPTFPDDDLVAEETHGDVLVQLRANTEETLLNALRDMMRATRGTLALRWKIDGFRTAKREDGAGRNLLGFKDGTANPDVDDAKQMNDLLWTQSTNGARAWTAAGTFAVVRIIRNRVEFWDRVARGEQELMIGRNKSSGAPLGHAAEQDDPSYGDDPKGERIPLDAHIRVARPRTAGTENQRILRRGYNYSRGIDDAGQLDMGLIFAAYNRDIERQFEVVQKRLAGEPLVDYVKPTGGGYFFLPPGAQGTDDWVGSGLFV
jgi:deferrochelatase/peroxidase EfeB